MGEVGDLGALVEVQEGLARILVPEVHGVRGPGKLDGRPFYNEAMAFPRHVSVLVVGAVSSGIHRVLDGLASTGVLGIRLALEAQDGFEIALNDWRRDAHQLILKNLELNGIEGAMALREELNSLLCRERFDYVDVDPFGSPVPFVDNALRSLRPRGYLAVTATDTAALAGAYSRVCRRRYGATPLRAPFSHEVGVRILVGYVARTAAKYDMAIRPLLSFWRGHYYRAYMEVTKGAKRAEEALSHLGYVQFEPGGPRSIRPVGEVGPLWEGALSSPGLLRGFSPREYFPHDVNRFVDWSIKEAEAPPLFYTTDEVSSALRIPAPSMEKVTRALREGGFLACRTTFHPKGFKTTASWDEILRLVEGR